MAAAYPLTLEAWNDLLERINNLARNPPEGCDALEELELVTEPHKWSETDIAAAREKLNAICSTNTFNAPSTGKWLKSIIDELDAAIENGWCGCEEEPCCVPQGTGTVQINPGGYYVTIPFSQIVEQYLYGNVSYSDMVAAMGSDVVAHLEECVGGPTGQIIHYTLYHHRWTNCVYQDRWVDDGSCCPWQGEGCEHWDTCSYPPAEIVDSGYVPALTPSYQSSTSVGPHTYYDQPMGMGYHYDYNYQRWYQTLWVGYFEVEVYVYDLRVEYICPSP